MSSKWICLQEFEEFIQNIFRGYESFSFEGGMCEIKSASCYDQVVKSHKNLIQITYAGFLQG
jgi:hypothetical protein